MNNLMAEAMRWFGPGDSVSLAEIRQTGATVVGCAFVIELDFLQGRAALGDCPVHALLHY